MHQDKLLTGHLIWGPKKSTAEMKGSLPHLARYPAKVPLGWYPYATCPTKRWYSYFF